MGRFIQDTKAERIRGIMFADFQASPGDIFLSGELARYVPEFSSASDDEIGDFADYQRRVYFYGLLTIGRPIASLNPHFVGSLERIKVGSSDGEVYTRASVKENGYRMQTHIGLDVSAFTRQFVPYDLRMFPELDETFAGLPVMIGDAELISKHHPHFQGFRRVNERIPNSNYWPSRETGKLDDAFLAAYLADETLFHDGKPLKDLELSLAFHGLYAIADPETWGASRSEQMQHLISLCPLPMDYRRVDSLLDRLGEHLTKRKLNARVVDRKVVRSKRALKAYVAEKEAEHLEGVCVVQVGQDDEGRRSFYFARSFKIKNYETVDAVVLGIMCDVVEHGSAAGNMTGAILGLYDVRRGMYVPAFKVNLDPWGVQVKEPHQRERLASLREDLSICLSGKITPDGKLCTLWDAYAWEGERLFEELLPRGLRFVDIVGNLPRGENIPSLLAEYKKNVTGYRSEDLGKRKSHSKKERFIAEHLLFFYTLDRFGAQDNVRFKELMTYARLDRNILACSRKLPKPDFLVDTSMPIIAEAKVYDLSFGLNPFPAGFHTSYGDSFQFKNVFAERLRHDKGSTTDLATIIEIARQNTMKNKQKKKH